MGRPTRVTAGALQLPNRLLPMIPERNLQASIDEPLIRPRDDRGDLAPYHACMSGSRPAAVVGALEGHVGLRT
jgi:hypothetical protein